MLQELADTEQLGSRGELWFLAQAVLLVLLFFPPGPLEVRMQRACNKRKRKFTPPALLKLINYISRPSHASRMQFARQLLLLEPGTIPDVQTCAQSHENDSQAVVRIGGVASAVAGLTLIVAGQQSLGNSLSPFPGECAGEPFAKHVHIVRAYWSH